MQVLRSGQGTGTFLSASCSTGQAPALGLGSLGESLKGLERFKNKHRVLGLGFEVELRSREKIRKLVPLWGRPVKKPLDYFFIGLCFLSSFQVLRTR